MITRNQILSFIIKIIPIIVVISSIFLLIHEFHQLNSLPSKYDSLNNSVVDFLKYKEDTYCQLFLWSLLFFAGLIGLINEKLKWIGFQIILTKLLISSLLLFFVDYAFSEIKFLAAGFLIGLIIIENRLYDPKLISKFQINKVNILSSIILGIISAAIYWTIRLNF